jgi:uncharacterized flavoprotein (TIGR03862 family)
VKVPAVAIYGSGPAALMAASELSRFPLRITLFERRPSLGRKLLIAGSSGLNISHDTGLDDFISHYQGFTPEVWRRFFAIFSPQDWIRFVEGLGLETFVGTSNRYFVREMKASGLLRAWRSHLEGRGVEIVVQHEWRGFEELMRFDASGLFLGGGSWEEESPRWPAIMAEAGVSVRPFHPKNVGYEVAWSRAFLAEAEGKPLKNMVLKNAKGEKAGELVITRYGLEGTPVYFLGEKGPAILDLKPSMSEGEILRRVSRFSENLSPIRRVKRGLSLGEAAMALLYHHTDGAVRSDLGALVRMIKAFPIEFSSPRPLAEAISSAGGIDLSEVSTEPGRELALKRFKGVFVGGEMLDWTAPTGGFLIQGAVTQGAVAAQSLLHFLGKVHP